ncbi:MAG: hypothetical protein U1E28_22995 [Beijerinckiaceae bacterium]
MSNSSIVCLVASAAVVACGLSGCSATGANVAATPVKRGWYEKYDCVTIKDKIAQVSAEAAQLTGEQRTDWIVQNQASLTVNWPDIENIEITNSSDRQNISKLKGEIRAITFFSVASKCKIDFNYKQNAGLSSSPKALFR